MSFLQNLITPGIRSHLLGAVGVIAVCGIASTSVAYVYIRQQNATIRTQSDRIGDLVETNKSWAVWATQQQKIAQLERENAEILQRHVSAIEAQSADMTQRMKELEASNEQVKEYMARPIPLELRRLLERK